MISKECYDIQKLHFRVIL